MHNDEIYETHSLTWADITALAKKYWKLVLIVFLSGIVGTYLALQLFFTNQYETKTKLLVKIGRENAELPPSVLNGQVLNQGVRIADINSEVELLSSRSLVERVVDTIGPDNFTFALPKPKSVFGYPKYIVKTIARWGKRQYQEFLILASIKKRLTPREKAIVGVSDGVKAEPMKESDVLLLKVQLPSPELSAQVSALLLRYYMDERAIARRVSSSTDLFEPEIDAQRDKLRSMTAERQQLRKTWHISSAEQQRGLLLEGLTKINQQITENEGEIAQLRQQRSVMSAKLGTVPEMLPKERVESRNPALQSIKDRLTTLQIERAKLSNRYQPDSETMKRTNTEIAELQTTLDRESPTVAMTSTTELNPVLREFKSAVEQSSVRIDGLVKKNDDLRTAAGRLNGELDLINRGGDAYDDLEREYKITEGSFIEYSKKRESAQISRELDSKYMPNVVVIGAAETPIEPVYPRHLFILGFAIPISLLMGIGLAALCESFDDNVHGERELAGLDGVPLLGRWNLEAPLKITNAQGYVR
jgi:uncharacterized protein involved in exopolysaccharide biosynthesis